MYGSQYNFTWYVFIILDSIYYSFISWSAFLYRSTVAEYQVVDV